MSSLSISEASRRWKIGRATIQRKIKAGALSLSQLDTSSKGNAKLIDTSELIRVFGEPLKQVDTTTKQNKQVKSNQVNNTVEIELLKAENKRLIEQLEFANSQIKHHMEKDKKLLEHQTKSLWKKLFS